MGQAKLRPNRVAEAIQRRIEKEREQEEQKRQRLAARKPFQLLKHQVQGAAILGAVFSMIDARARTIADISALQHSAKVRERPEVVVLEDKENLDVD